jgi:hypothetical protein
LKHFMAGNGARGCHFLAGAGRAQEDETMAKRVPIDCKRITPAHLRNLPEAELLRIVERIEIQAQKLNRARRLVAEAIDGLQV